MVTTDVLDRMEHVGETIVADEVVEPGQTAIDHDALVGSAKADVQPDSEDRSEGLLQGYPTHTIPTATLLPFLHVAFPNVTNQNNQTSLEGVVYSEGLPHAHTTNVTLAQPAPGLPHHHHHDPTESILSPQNIQVEPEDVEYWKGLAQVYPWNASNSEPAPALSLQTFPTWPVPNMNPQAQTEALTHPAPLHPLHQHQAYPSWPEQPNVPVKPLDRYWDGASTPPAPYSLTISSTYHGLQCQDGAMLQSHVLSAGYAYERQVRKR